MADPELLSRDGIRLGCDSAEREEVIRQVGGLLVELGAVAPAYIDAMLEREAKLSSYVGEGFAIPHGTDESRAHIIRPALAVLQFPDGIDWEGQTVHMAIGIAAQADEHLAVMSNLAMVLLDAEQAELLRTTDDVDAVLALLSPTD